MNWLVMTGIIVVGALIVLAALLAAGRGKGHDKGHPPADTRGPADDQPKGAPSDWDETN